MMIVCWKLILPLAFVCAALAQDKFYFSVSPEDVSAPAGSAAVLRCAVSEARGISYGWTYNGRPVAASSRRQIQHVDAESQLRIGRLDRVRDQGEVACTATNTSSGFSLTSRTAVVQVQWLSESADVELHTPESPEEVVDGEDVVLACTVDGSGDIRVDWFRNGERVTRNSHVSFGGAGALGGPGPGRRQLHLRGASPRDNGVYRCSATSVAGTVSTGRSFALAVPGPAGEKWPLIQVPPQDTVARRGDAVRLDCSYRDASFTEWYFKDTGPLKNASRFNILENGSLLLTNVGRQDEGPYACVGIREDAELPQKYTAQLTLAYLEEFSSASFDPELSSDHLHIIPENAPFHMTCKPPRGVPQPKVKWLDPEGQPISDSGPLRVEETRLYLESASSKESSGNYTCVAENLAGIRSETVRLLVSTPPTITKDPVSMVVGEDEPAVLTCHFSGMAYPVTTVRWRKDGKTLRDDANHIHIEPSNGTLKINSVVSSDRGEYVCLVNTTGFNPIHSKPAQIQVKEKLKFTPQPVNKKMELGSVSKVNCKAQGSTVPTIHWLKEGGLPSHVSVHNGTLVFNGVKSSDKGRYTCVANNAQGTINATITIDVHVTPKFIVLPKNPSEAVEGYSVMIDCAAEGDPKPTIHWDKNSVMMNDLGNQRFVVLENGSLLIHEAHLSDQGNYGCTAGNSGGFKRAEVSLFVRSAEGYIPDGPDSEINADSMMTKTVVITLGAAAAYMFLVVGLMVWCRCRRRRRKQNYLAQETAEVGKGDNVDTACAANGDAELGERSKRLSKASSKQNGHAHTNGHARSDGENTAQSQSSNHSKKSKTSYDALSFARADLQNLMLLGNGEMGEVYLAQAKGLGNSTAPVQDGTENSSNFGVVMVKALNQTRNEASLLEFRRQIDLFQRVNHPNIVSLLGLCREQDPHYMLLQYSDWGDLKQFLLASREKSSRKSPQSPQPPQPPKPAPLTFAQIVSLANQAAQALEHLSNLRLVHKDIAARNCLIASGLRLKISLSGLCKDTYKREYFEYKNQTMPLRWLPHEAVFEDDFSAKSDVYSYGVLVWEILTQAEFPFHRKTDNDVVSSLQNHELHWKIPKNCTPAMTALLGRCWADSPRDRPTFSQIVLAISEMKVDTEM
ncbi:inactive tyrosine-protein kinase 7-like isoform X2 [Thrips palmi]|uniref:Inactive tyrosine-protein kinase 7-like isoform X2 n=1 Tax=Thrips palmi TaxID=161013 RepID=A0A6P8YE50_THRPL|nr:inactive tyrosine-protein kinase 7-like isoform X2 [Thrips palmi]